MISKVMKARSNASIFILMSSSWLQVIMKLHCDVKSISLFFLMKRERGTPVFLLFPLIILSGSTNSDVVTVQVHLIEQ